MLAVASDRGSLSARGRRPKPQQPPVTEDYKVPFKFTGNIASVTIELKGMKKTELDDAVQTRKAASLKKVLSD